MVRLKLWLETSHGQKVCGVDCNTWERVRHPRSESRKSLHLAGPVRSKHWSSPKDIQPRKLIQKGERSYCKKELFMNWLWLTLLWGKTWKQMESIISRSGQSQRGMSMSFQIPTLMKSSTASSAFKALWFQSLCLQKTVKKPKNQFIWLNTLKDRPLKTLRAQLLKSLLVLWNERKLPNFKYPTKLSKKTKCCKLKCPRLQVLIKKRTYFSLLS